MQPLKGASLYDSPRANNSSNNTKGCRTCRGNEDGTVQSRESDQTIIFKFAITQFDGRVTLKKIASNLELKICNRSSRRRFSICVSLFVSFFVYFVSLCVSVGAWEFCAELGWPR